MLVSNQFVSAEAEYRRAELSKLYPKNRRAVRDRTVRDGRRGLARRIREAWVT